MKQSMSQALPRPPGFSACAVCVLFCITAGWAFFLGDIDGNIAALAEVSSSVKLYSDRLGLIIGAGLLMSYTVGLLAAWLISKKPFVFIGIWVFSLAVSEARIPGFQQVMLLIRYFMMMALIVYGGIAFAVSINRKWHPIQKMGLALIALLIMHLFVDKYETEALLLLPMQLAMYVGLFFGLSQVVRTEKDLYKICLALAFVGIIMTFINLLAFKFAFQPIQGGRYRSWYSLATGFANNYVLFLIPIIWLFIQTRSSALKLLLIMIVVTGLYMLVLSGSRNALLTLTVALFIACALWKPKYFIYFILIGVVGAGLLYVMGDVMKDLGSAGSRLGKVSNTETRFIVWKLAWSYIQESPFWGYGLSVDLQSLASNLPVWEQFDAHNAYLGLWLRLGILGLLINLVIYFWAIYRGARLLLELKGGAIKASLILFLSLVISIFVAGLFEENLSSRGSVQQAMWAMSVAMILVIYKLCQRKTKSIRGSSDES